MFENQNSALLNQQNVIDTLTQSIADGIPEGAVSEGQRGSLGALNGGSPCRLSILRNGNVACLCRLFMPMSHVEFKKKLCHVPL